MPVWFLIIGVLGIFSKVILESVRVGWSLVYDCGMKDLVIIPYETGNCQTKFLPTLSSVNCEISRRYRLGRGQIDRVCSMLSECCLVTC